MTGSARANLGCVVRAGESYQGKQGPTYSPGISAQSAGSRAIWLGSGTIPAHGGRTKAHLHEDHETAIYFLGGDEVELWTGERLEHREVAHPGDYLCALARPSRPYDSPITPPSRPLRLSQGQPGSRLHSASASSPQGS
jgi:uncharacterized RmlC-like cupin family protein